MKYFFLSSAIKLFSCLPLSAVRALGACLASITGLFTPEFVKVTRRNIELCYPTKTPQERNMLCNLSIKETTILSLEVFKVWNTNQQGLRHAVKFKHGEQIILNAAAEQKGVIVLAPHIGNWEVLGKILPEYGPLMSLYAPPKNLVFERLVKQAREASGATLVPTNNRGIAKLLKHLKSGGITGILPDQVPLKASGDYADFFGISALTMTLIHGLANRTNCKIVLGAAIRTKNGFELHFLPPDPLIYSSNQEESLLGLNKSVEKAIALAPAQWQWEYKRFKRQPTKAISYYDF